MFWPTITAATLALAIMIFFNLHLKGYNKQELEDDKLITFYKANKQFIVYIPKAFDSFKAGEYNYKRFSLELTIETDKMLRKVFANWTKTSSHNLHKRKFITKTNNYNISIFAYIEGKNKKITYKLVKTLPNEKDLKNPTITETQIKKEVKDYKKNPHILLFSWNSSTNFLKSEDEYALAILMNSIDKNTKNFWHNISMHSDERGRIIFVGNLKDSNWNNSRNILKLKNKLQNIINNRSSFQKHKGYLSFINNKKTKNYDSLKQTLLLCDFWQKNNEEKHYAFSTISKTKSFKEIKEKVNNHLKLIAKPKHSFIFDPIINTEGKVFGFNARIKNFGEHTKVLKKITQTEFDWANTIVKNLLTHSNKFKRKKFIVNVDLSVSSSSNPKLLQLLNKSSKTNIVLNIRGWKYFDKDYLRSLTLLMHRHNVNFSFDKVFNFSELKECLDKKPYIISTAKNFLNKRNHAEISAIINEVKTNSKTLLFIKGIDNKKKLSLAFKNKVSYIEGSLIKLDSSSNKLSEETQNHIKERKEVWAFIK